MTPHSTQDSDEKEKIKKLEQEVERLKSLELELTKAVEASAAASNAKSEFIANISHDLRTPLHAILSFSRFGVNKIDKIDKGKVIKYFSSIEESGKKLQVMLDKLVDLSKLESGRIAFQMYTSKLSLVIQSLEKGIKSRMDEKKITLQVEATDEADSVHCDQYRIAFVMNTLLTNAIENSPDKSKVTICIEKAQDPLASSESMLKVSVRDHRTEQFPNELLSNFEKYLQKEKVKVGNGNLGVNLAICNEIVKQHKGKLWAEEASGSSSFCFSLPADQ